MQNPLVIIFRFHSEASEPVLGHAVMPPLRDDVQLSVDEYRNKLYELMSVGTKAHIKHIRVNHDNRYWKIWCLVIDSLSTAVAVSTN